MLGGLSIELESLEAAVGSSALARGRRFAKQNRVLSLVHGPEPDQVSGAVIGNGGLYQVTATLGLEGDRLTFVDGECTCPMGWNCKHVAALMIAAANGSTVRGIAPPRPAAPAWEQPLRELAGIRAAAGAPLALDLKLEAGTRRLTARLLRPGARGGWVKGGLTWDGLEGWNRAAGELRPDHLTLARELRALQRVGARSSYLYGYGSEKTLELSACESPRLWSVLEEARRAGVTLLHGQAEVPPPVDGTVSLDITAGADGGIEVAAVLDVDEERPPWTPLAFIGATAHGVVCGEPEQDLRLVRLARPVPVALQRMLLDRARITVPAADRRRFEEEHYPALRHVAAVMSSDASFVAPSVSPPELVLRAVYGGADHAVDVGWVWRYEIGDRTLRAPLPAGPDGPGFRDLEAERGVLAGLDLAHTSLGDFGLLDNRGRPSRMPVRLTGMDTVRLTTECLPELTDHPDLSVEVDGARTDFRDVGASLDVGVSTAQSGAQADWFDLGVSITVEGREVPFADVFTALAAGVDRLLLPDGAHFSLLDPRLQTLRDLIEEARELSDAPGDGLRISRYQSGLWLELAALGVVTEQAAAWQRQVEAIATLGALSDHALPAGLHADLRPYQREGFNWLATLWDLGLGGILADDMGLGKTLQTLALIAHARERDPESGAFLVVAPTSVVPNWAAEAARFAPGLNVATVADTMAKSGMDVAELAGADVVVTTYTLFRLDAERYGALRWAGLILDEAQYVKNHQAKTYRCVRELTTPFKLAITGTPMENNLMELWALLSITAPGLFPEPKRFAERYARPIERAGNREQLTRLRSRIKPLVKRRTKELVAADLPARQEQTLAIDLHPRHRRRYDAQLQRERQKILGLLDDMDRNRFTILRSLTLLRQLSLHPVLVEEAAGNVPCTKLDALVEQVAEVAHGGHRALVFSQFTRFLALVRDRLDREGVGYCYLDGRTRRRQQVIEQFKTGPDPVFLISLKAGGAGLNLTEADYCFLLDPWWNPATEQQAIDRTHRIGQTRPVHVYRLLARDTIEEKVVELARRKAELVGSVLDDGDLFSGSLTAADIRALLA